MADCILKYSLLNKAAGPTALRQEPFRSVFYDSLSELCVCLEQKGFEVRPSLAWEDREICADSKYITRILDNICSNIIKYASCGDPIRIESFYQTDGRGLVFENKKSANQTQAESTGIGVRNIREMMEEMGGCCEAEETSEDYRIRLTFACSPPFRQNGQPKLVILSTQALPKLPIPHQLPNLRKIHFHRNPVLPVYRWRYSRRLQSHGSLYHRPNGRMIRHTSPCEIR